MSSLSMWLGWGFLASELGLALRRRAARGGKVQNADRGSLRLLWIVNMTAVIVAISLAISRVHPPLPEDVAWPVIGLVLFVFGAALRWWSIWHLGRFFTVNVALAEDHQVISTGPYRWIRHPSYTGVLLQFAGLGLTLGTWPSLLVLVGCTTAAMLWRIHVEEAALRAHLGSAYIEYASSTKRLVPFLF